MLVMADARGKWTFSPLAFDRVVVETAPEYGGKNMAHSEYSLLSPINATTPTLPHNLPDSGATK